MDTILLKIEIVAQQWFAFIAASSIQLGVFLILVFIIASIFKKQSARFLYLVWLIGLLKIFIPPTIKLPAFISSSKFMPESQISLIMIPEIHVTPDSLPGLSYQSYLFLFWLLMAISLLIFWLYHAIRFRRRILQGCREIGNDLENIEAIFNGDPIKVFTGPNISMPFTRGIFSSKIYLPEPSLKWSKVELKALLLHELAHIKRKDILVIGIQNIIQLLHFFHPLVWLANVQLARLREKACDDAAIQALQSKSTEYGKLLLKSIDQAIGWRPIPSLSTYFHQSKKFLINRFHYILNRKESIMNRLNLSQRLVLIGLMIFGIAFSCQKQEQPSQPIQIQGQDGIVVKNVPDLEVPILQSPAADAATFFVAYDEPPQPIGGFEAIQRNLVYPELARRAGIEGTVIVYAQIGINGEVVAIRILKSLGENNGCDEAAVAAIKAVKWQPAKAKGQPVSVWVSIPVKFKIRGDQSTEKGLAVPLEHTDAIEKTEAQPLKYTPPSLPPDDAATFFVPYDKPPEPIGGFERIQRNLAYPELAQKAGIEGQVTVFARIDEKGDVIDTKILVPLGKSGCNEAAVAAIKSVKWQPAQADGKPATVWISVPVRFKLH